MFWLLFLALMILVPLLAGLLAWRELRQETHLVVEAALPPQNQQSADAFSMSRSPRL